MATVAETLIGQFNRSWAAVSPLKRRRFPAQGFPKKRAAPHVFARLSYNPSPS